jgi:1,4-alpha-glucan branching enzyme
MNPSRARADREQAAMQSTVPAATVEAIVEGRHDDPFAVLGVHEAGGAVVVRAFVPGAESVDVVTRDGATLASLARRHAGGFFEGTIPRALRTGCARPTSRGHGSPTTRMRTGRFSALSTTG